MAKQKALYGTWQSPIKPRMVASSMRLQDVQWDTDGETLVWVESRGTQSLLVAQRPNDSMHDLTNADMSVRGKIGYGGGDFTVANGMIYFVGNGGRLYKLSVEGGNPRAITPSFGAAASPTLSPDGKWIIYVHQDNNVDGLALVDSDGALFPRKFAYGNDFVMDPTWHPQGAYVAYVTWDHPNMPWDGAELKLARLEYDAQGVPFAAQVDVIAGDADTAVTQPEFSPDGTKLAYLSDVTGWWQLYVYDLATGEHLQVTKAEVEHGLPAWRQRARLYGWSSDGNGLFFMRNEGGFWSVWKTDAQGQHESKVEGLDDYTHLTQIALAKGSDRLALLASSSVTTERVITVETQQPATPLIRRRTSAESISKAALSPAERITWTGHDAEMVHGYYHAPSSERFEGLGAPPLIVHVHGGPTSQARTSYNADIQFFATRGYAVLQVNHRGGTGYGREYMLKHRGKWGVYDVEDSVTGAEYLVSQGLADPKKLIIMGGSAGGYTVLQSLVDKPGFYSAGVCLYGISNQFTLVLESADWKFESLYSYKLLGTLPEAADVYRDRSPLFFADKITDPVIVFQGSDDVIVPQSQSDSIVAVLKARGVPHEYHVYEGEGHGWRKPQTIEAYLNATLNFLNQHIVYR